MREVRNSFEAGRNTDVDPSKISAQQYLEAHNVEIVGSGKFFALQNINGTSKLKEVIIDSDLETLKILPNKYLISGVLVNCLTIFTAKASQKFKIWCYDIENNTLYELYEETIASDYLTSDRVVEATNFPENGIDIVYFTDFYNEIRYLKCEIPNPYSANFLNSYDLSLLRKGANGSITLSSVSSGGTLLSGTYQFAYRMAEAANKKFTKWSTLTNPIHVYDRDNSITTAVKSGIGLVTDRKITLSITPSTEETDNFDQIQLAVVENTGPTEPITASLLEIESIPGTSLTYNYKSNSKIGTIPLEDITVDLAQIKKIKTLAIKDNRLIGGNVHYTSLEFDNGTPTISGGSILSQADSQDSFSSDTFASKHIGYWRGEVYRFGVVFIDKDGNKSPVSPLDLSSVTGNQITSGLKDMKFPTRSQKVGATTFTVFNSLGRTQSLGLRVSGLSNIPSWARSVEVVRLPRKKNILFESPIVPMMTVHGTGALDNYPSTVTYSTNLGVTKTIDNATPMSSGSMLVPKNLFWPEQRSILKNTETSGSGTSKKIAGEVRLQQNSTYEWSIIFPPQSMYEPANPFVYTGAEKLDFVDYALLKTSITDDTDSSSLTGDDLNTNISGTFYAVADSQYYFDSAHSKSDISHTNRAITDYEMFDNLAQPDTVSGRICHDYESFQTGGVPLGFKPTTQRSAAIKMGGPIIPDIMSSGATFAAATLNSYSAGGSIVSGGTVSYESSLTNKYINEYSGFTNSSYVQAVGIVSVKLGLGDDRYGELTDLHEYISTGTKYTFSSSEVATLEAGGSVSISNLDVWGGDCFVSHHVFKVADTAYSVVNQPKQTGSPQTTTELLSKWSDTLYLNIDGSCFLSLPVAVENAAQYIQVVIQSEYNGEVREPDILNESGIIVPIFTGTSTTARSPLTYKYNINLSKQNSQRIYVPEPQFSFKQDEFGSRVIYSDIKLYNSDQPGFDIFRVANVFDLEEKYYPITKLALAGNNLYALQERGIIYLPTGENQVEQSDGGTLAVRSGDVIGKPIIIDSERGCQHPRGVVETGGVIYIPDNRNKNVYALAGQELKSITKDNESEFRTMFASQFSGKNILGVYDPVREEYWLISNASPYYCQVYNEKLQNWVSNYEFSASGKLYGGVYTNQNLYLVGYNTSTGDTSIYTMYTGTINQLFGISVTPRIVFSTNPDSEFSKIFDVYMISASERLSGADFAVSRESEVGNQTATSSLDIAAVEGNYRVKTLRDSTGGRLRGMYCSVTVRWKSVKSALKAVWCRYRLSSRRPW